MRVSVQDRGNILKGSEMNSIQELLGEAIDEVLQEAWDRALLAAFRSVEYPITANVCAQFVKDQNISWRKFYELKRTPRYERQNRTRVPRFIAAFLPRLNDRLWDTKMSDDELVAWMNKIDLETQGNPEDKMKVMKEAVDRMRSNRDVLANALELRQVNVVSQAYGRNWKTVKSVRNKK